MKPSAYVETSVISYLAAFPSRDVVTAAHQAITHEWWQGRERFDLFVSQLVLIEARRGDPGAAARRSRLLEDIQILALDDRVRALARLFMDEAAVPRGSSADAAHIAVAAIHGADFLVTWNCRQIANAFAVKRVRGICESQGLFVPTICTPEQFSHVESPTDPI